MTEIKYPKKSEAAKRRWKSQAYRDNVIDHLKKRVYTKEHRANIGKSLKNRKFSEETLIKMRKPKGKKPIRTPEHNKKIGESNKGHPVSAEVRKILSESHKGEKSPTWKGGVSFEPYCPKFNAELKERVRVFFGNICVECGNPQNGKKHQVHHVNFNKMTCCDGTPPLFVTLCRSCHSKTIYNRPYWEQHFTDMINQYYGGKCYLTKEEMECLK